MRRRELLTFPAQAAALAVSSAYPSRAQPLTSPLVGFLGGTAPIPDIVAPFVEGLAQAGFSDGRNVDILYVWANNQPARLPELVADLLRRSVSVIATNGGAIPVRAVQAASKSVPIVFLVGDDPARMGLVASLNRPGGSATGVYMLTASLNAKRVELLHQMVPQATTMAILVNPAGLGVQAIEAEVRAATAALHVQPLLVRAGTEREIDAAFETIARQRIGALVLGNDPFFNSRREQLVALATRHGLPAIFEWREFTAGGGLMSYGADRAGALREQGTYVARVLKGARPADLPVLQPRRFELVINGKTAQTLGLTIPQTLLLRADEVIE